MAGYNYDSFSEDEYDLNNFDGPELGDKAPDFPLVDLDGAAQRLLDFDGDFMVLEFGSITCPLFQSRRSGMADLPARFANVDFRIVYVREAHPGQTVGAHGSLNEKTGRARQLRDEQGEQRQILIDDMKGAVHAAYGAFPNGIFIVNRKGCIVYRSVWSNPAATEKALARLVAGKPAPREGLFWPAKPPVAIQTLRRAGKGAGLDFLRSLPAMAWKNLVRRNLTILLGRRPKVRPDAAC
jgi:Iodothyronine deiodinase